MRLRASRPHFSDVSGTRVTRESAARHSWGPFCSSALRYRRSFASRNYLSTRERQCKSGCLWTLWQEFRIRFERPTPRESGIQAVGHLELKFARWSQAPSCIWDLRCALRCFPGMRGAPPGLAIAQGFAGGAFKAILSRLLRGEFEAPAVHAEGWAPGVLVCP